MHNSTKLLIKNIERAVSGASINSVFKNSEIPHSTISRILNEESSPSLNTLDKIANILKKTPSELISGDEQESKFNIPIDILIGLDNKSDDFYESIRGIISILDSQNKKKEKTK